LSACLYKNEKTNFPRQSKAMKNEFSGAAKEFQKRVIVLKVLIPYHD